MAYRVAETKNGEMAIMPAEYHIALATVSKGALNDITRLVAQANESAVMADQKGELIKMLAAVTFVVDSLAHLQGNKDAAALAIKANALIAKLGGK